MSSTTKRRILIGAAALIDLHGVAQCGGVVARTKRMQKAANFKSTFTKKKMQKKVIN